MKYLFFDLEYATCVKRIKICEFGYVLTDENFNVIERNNFIINPNILREEWDLYALNNILTRKLEVYENSKLFTEYYEKIKELIKTSDYVFGHSLDGDVKALNDELLRYNLDQIDFTFYDIRPLYQYLFLETKATGLSNMINNLNIDHEDRFHDAETDSYNTMLVLKELQCRFNSSTDDFIKNYPTIQDKTINYVIETVLLHKDIQKINKELYHNAIDKLINEVNDKNKQDDNNLGSLFANLDFDFN